MRVKARAKTQPASRGLRIMGTLTKQRGVEPHHGEGKVDGRRLHHKLAVEAIKVQTGLDKPREHVLHLRGEQNVRLWRQGAWPTLEAGEAGAIAGYF